VLIAVTGATGFVGGHVVGSLLEHGHEVVGYGRRSDPPWEPRPGLEYQRWDITSGPIEGAADAVVHCAGSVTEWGSDEQFNANNVIGTHNALDSFRHARVFVHISTASVYNLSTRKHSLNEESPLATHFLSGYSRSKVAAEGLVTRAPGNSVVLRPHIVYGRGDTKILPRLLAMRRLGALVVPGDGQSRLSVTHVQNLADAVVLAIERRAGHEVFNIADSLTGTVDELLTSLQSAFGLKPRIWHVPASAAWRAAVAVEWLHRSILVNRAPRLTRFLVAQLAFDFTLDIQRAIDVLGYRTTRSYPEAFRELASDTRLISRSLAESIRADRPNEPR
jgi:nucleoside-diphosphate-sugar epimerase